MWLRVADFILKYRIVLLIAIGLLAATMGYIGISRAKFSQQFAKVVPKSDKDYREYLEFRERYGEDGGTLLIGLEGDAAFKKEALNDLYRLAQEIEREDGVRRVIHVTKAYQLEADTARQRFEMQPVMTAPLQSQAQADSLQRWLYRQPFYKGLLYSPDQEISIFAVSYSEAIMESKVKHKLIRNLEKEVNALAEKHGFTPHYAGLPYVRYYISKNLPNELAIFSTAAILLTALALYLFYRSFYAVVFPIILLVMSAFCTLGIIGLFDYELNILMAMLPTIIIILGIPPSIYMLSDYHREYRELGNEIGKIGALREMIRKLGLVTLMINGNTALGFLTLYFTEVRILQQFGLVAFLGTMTTYVLTIILIPSVYSLLPSPSDQKLKHLEAPRINRIILTFVALVQNHRKSIYIGAGVLVVAGGFGITLLRPVAYMMDDIPRNDNIYSDLKLMEEHFGGVMPLEIVLDTRRPDGALKYRNLKRTAKLQQQLESYPQISRTVSLVNLVKWSRQALSGVGPKAYEMPVEDEYDFLQIYAKNSGTVESVDTDTARGAPQGGMQSGKLLTALTDSSQQEIRITGFVEDIGSQKMPQLMAQIQADIDSIFRTEQSSTPIKTTLTGTTRIFLKANDYLVNNLYWSLLAVFCIIALQMLVLFSSWRIMLISLIPNIIPLILTTGIMGYFGIPLKPSTALIFIMAFGIAIDDSIHFLAMYRLHRKNGLMVSEATAKAQRITGMSIMYTSIVLFMGFIIFVPSSFGSTRSLGLLTSITLFFAGISNLLLLPALLVRFDKRTWKAEKTAPEPAEAS